jgi:hypothetical protein
VNLRFDPLGKRLALDIVMAEEKKEAPKEDVPAHSTEQEKERLNDFNKGGIPPGSS